MNLDSILFVFENKDRVNPTLVRYESGEREAVCSLNEKEIFFYDKGAIPYRKIEKVTVALRSEGHSQFLVHVMENTQWNNTQKAKHPILWRLGLVNKSRAYTQALGNCSDQESIEKLKSFFQEKGIAIIEE